MGRKKAKGNLQGKPASNGKPSVTSIAYLPTAKVSPPALDKSTHDCNGKCTIEKKRQPSPYDSVASLAKRNSHELRRVLSLQKPEFDESKVEILFNKYKDDNEDSILAVGIEKFCEDLKVDPMDFRVLALAWKFEASQMCRFTRKEFLDGCRKLKADSLKSIGLRIPDLEDEVLKSKDKFKDLYRFTYGFGLDIDEGQKTLPIQIALALWKIVFARQPPQFIEQWYKFLDEKQVKGISRDTWNMFLHLVENVKYDFSNYDISEAWPSLFDEFVEYMQEQTTHLDNYQSQTSQFGELTDRSD